AARAAMGRWKAARIHVPAGADLSGFMGEPAYAPSGAREALFPAFRTYPALPLFAAVMSGSSVPRGWAPRTAAWSRTPGWRKSPRIPMSIYA
ncbi:hypothetical protein ACWDSD_43940, partial [Streptomyces spiralis]